MVSHRGSLTPVVVAGVLLLCTASAPRLNAQPFIIKNINATEVALGSGPTFFADIGERSYFYASKPGVGVVLGVTDGTTPGTSLFDLGPFGSSELVPVGVVGDIVYFLARADLTLRSQLWRSDGTAAGTFQLTTGLIFDTSPRIGDLTDRGLLFFSAADPEAGAELWVTDGSVPGTRRVADIYPGPLGSSLMGGLSTTGELLFVAVNPDSGTELWKTDGTEAGTLLVADLVAGPGSSGPERLTEFGAGALFTAADAAHGRELWISDGTASGTRIVKDLNPGAAGSVFEGGIVADGGHAYFSARDSAPYPQLWVTDGTTAGTVRLTSLGDGGVVSDTPGLAAFGQFYFAVEEPIHGQELWVTNGTAAGTHLVADVCPGDLQLAAGAAAVLRGQGAVRGAGPRARHGTVGDRRQR